MRDDRSPFYDRRVKLIVLAWLLTAFGSAAATPSEPGRSSQSIDPPPRRLEVWARAQFDESGTLAGLELADESRYSPTFVQQVKRQLSDARITPPVQEGRNARLHTGIRLIYEVRVVQGAGSLTLLSTQASPIPIRRSASALPSVRFRSEGRWSGSLTGVCSVNAAGQCTSVTLKANGVVPEAYRRWVRQTMLGWSFEPQRVNDEVISGEFDHTFNFDVTVTQLSPEYFTIPKFDRIEHSR